MENGKTTGNALEYSNVKKQIREKLSNVREFDDKQNLLELGLDSLQIMRLANIWRRAGASVTFAKLIEEPTLEHWCKLLADDRKSEPASLPKEFLPETRVEDVSFPLTDVQYSYWVGRSDDRPLGGIGCHAYLEFDGERVDPVQLGKAWEALKAHHPMLRARFLKSGEQIIGKCSASPPLAVHDFKDKSTDEAEKELENLRQRLSHRRLDVEKGRVIGLELALLPHNKTRLYFDVDLLVADVQSLQILLRDLSSAYMGRELPAESKDWNFAAYLKNQKEKCEKEKEEAAGYWRERLPNLPLAPELPFSKKPEQIKHTRFKRRSMWLDMKEWDSIQKIAAAYRITPAMVLLTAYAKVIERWSANSRFLINIPLFNRKTEIRGIEEAVADFTDLLLLEVDMEKEVVFIDTLFMIQAQFHRDVAHAAYSGVQVQRDMARLHGGWCNFAPVVFACNLGTPLIDGEFKKNLGSFNYMVSQTPQVYIDFQTYEWEEGLMLIWDSVDELFPEHMVDDMFEAFGTMVNGLADIRAWTEQRELLTKLQLQRRDQAFGASETKNKQCLHTAFFRQALKNPHGVALVDSLSQKTVTYGELAEKSLSVAACLMENGISDGEAVAVTIPRGINQIAAVMGILAAGNCYVPVSTGQPPARREVIHNKLKITAAVTDTENKSKIQWPEGCNVFEIEEMLSSQPSDCCKEGSPEQSAYIILTSGTTGEPKGVEIKHSSAWNTVLDINTRYGVGNQDKVLAVSALDFDLSVYDVFGVLGAGGSVVLLPEEERKNPSYWLEQVERYGITLWNSVPVLFDMLLISARSMGREKLPLRIVMLSGDWIGLDLPERMQQHTEHCRMVAMGGATEASIWSNYFDVMPPLPEHWVSIPYGKALSNQSYRIVDRKGRDCPDWVEGELWIGGAGVAKGYRGDDKLTGERFVIEGGVRWYRTGDMGRFWPDGTIEFLGRRDFQVKIRGHRIELEEIEEALKHHPGIRNAVVIVPGETHANKYLKAYVVPDVNGHESIYETEESRDRENILWKSINMLPVSRKTVKADKRTAADIEGFYREVDSLAVGTIFRLLNNLGAWKKAGDNHTLESVFEEFQIDLRYKNLVANWLDILTGENILERNEKGRFVFTGNNVKLPEVLKAAGSYCGQNTKIGAVIRYLEELEHYGAGMLKGKISPLELFYAKELPLSLERLGGLLPGGTFDSKVLEAVLKELAKTGNKDKPVRVLEFGTRNNQTTKMLLDCLCGENTRYTYADTSLFFLKEGEKEFSDLKDIRYEMLDINKGLEEQGFSGHSFECVIAINSLHRTKNIDAALANISRLLAPNGVAVIWEMTANTYIQQVTAGFLEEGFSNFEDERKELRVPLLTEDQWLEKLGKGYFEHLAVLPALQAEFDRGILLLAQMHNKVEVFAPGKIEGYLQGRLPEYMIPKSYVLLKELPFTDNGKVDRKALLKEEKSRTVRKETVKPETEIQKKVSEFWSRIFSIQEVGLHDNYFELGGDSLIATKLAAMIREQFQTEFSLGTIFERPTVFKLAEAIEHSIKDEIVPSKPGSVLPEIVPETENASLPFPLTDVQYAYWVGRKGIYELGGVSTHCYFELDGDNLDISRLNLSWNRLIKCHGMMRAVISDDGNQQMLESVPEYRIETYDMRGKAKDRTAEHLEKVRKDMSHQVISTEQWPLFDVRASLLGESGIRLHISFDNLIFDGWSMFHLLSQWAKLYRDEKMSLTKPDLTFRDYVLGLERIKETKVYEDSRIYWTERLDTLPAAPELPLASESQTVSRHTFQRRSYKLNKADWHMLKRKAKRLGITPSVLLISAYAEALRMWSKNPDFTINLTQFNRLPIHGQISQIVGDFTTLTLLEVNPEGCNSFMERTYKLQRQLMADLEYSYFGGVEVQRELTKKSGGRSRASMPVVFTSGLGVDRWNEGEWLGKLVYNVSQTPQVWLDHQVVEQDGSLCLFWDSVDQLFYPGMLDEMFKAYCQLLERLSREDDIWRTPSGSILSITMPEAIIKANDTGCEITEETLDSLLLKAAQRFGSKTAVVSQNRTLSYSELVRYASQAAWRIKQQGIAPGAPVAVLMEKGWEQIVAVYAALFAEAMYLPVDSNNPAERTRQIMDSAGVELILGQSWVLEKHGWLQDKKCIAVDKLEMSSDEKTVKCTRNSPQTRAYAIYTSGSTGSPKGVVIDHRGAVNTILDVNKRFCIDSKDSVLAISNLSFDLSVYDIFGILAAGGTVVVPDAGKVREPAYWAELINRENITVWNSVPMFMQMLVELVGTGSIEASRSLRVVLLSGDWIPLELPDKIKSCFKNAKVIGLGGATEASIWSNFHVVEEIGKNWKSIPYGRPLGNQKYHILNKFMADCPVWAVGNLYISGIGVAREYINDSRKTEEKFVLHPVTGERMYCTGDLGRYWPDGTIEFLGREDSQVKISGYRIELGEIEAAVRQYQGIKEAVVTAAAVSEGSMKPVCFVSLDEVEKISFKEDSMVSFLRQKLPGYMIPALFIKLESIPLTGNGKVDRIKLSEFAAEKISSIKTKHASVTPETDTQKNILSIWMKIFNCGNPGIDDDFFGLGGNSLQAIQLINDLNGIYPVNAGIEVLFENPTIRALANKIEEKITEVRNG